jgi:hypothetical protein
MGFVTVVTVLSLLSGRARKGGRESDKTVTTVTPSLYLEWWGVTVAVTVVFFNRHSS